MCGTGIVYARTVAQRTLSFGVSGMLYKDGLVMYDRQSDTLWTHVDGRAVRGALAGQQLEIVPSVHATWKEWRTLYPNSLVLKKGAGDFRSPYEDYNRDPSRIGILGRRNPDKRLPPKERIIGVRAGNREMAFPLKAVREARIVHAQVGDQPILVVAARPDLPVLVFERRVGAQILRFRLEDVDRQTILRDEDTGSTWDLATGKAIAGTLAGASLRRANAVPAFWFGWRSYFPFSELWQAPQTAKR